MNKLLSSLVVFLACTASVSAALPPLAQSIAELKALLMNEEVASSLGMAESIQRIEKTDSGYLVTTRSKELAVDVIYLPAQNIGPLKFDLKFQPVQTAEH